MVLLPQHPLLVQYACVCVCVCVPYVMLQLDEGVNPADGSKNDALQSPESGP